MVLSPKLYAQLGKSLPATCGDLVTDIDMWGFTAAGVDLRTYTNSTLHWIGCLDEPASCALNTFFCDYDQITQTLSFGKGRDGTSPLGHLSKRSSLPR